MLVREDYEAFRQARQTFQSHEGKIHGRMTEVIKLYLEFFGKELDTWYFDDAGEGEMGTFKEYGGEIHYRLEHKPIKDRNVDKYARQLFDRYYSAHVSLARLFETDENIIEELREQVEAIKQEAGFKIQKEQERKARQEKIKEKALSKLSSEELKALGV